MSEAKCSFGVPLKGKHSSQCPKEPGSAGCFFEQAISSPRKAWFSQVHGCHVKTSWIHNELSPGLPMKDSSTCAHFTDENVQE